MYAVLKTGGKQYKVQQDDILRFEKLEADAGQVISLDKVMMVSNDGNNTLGDPFVEGASVSVEVIEQKRDRKVVIFKKRRRKSSQRKRGHKQNYSLIRILEILTDGAVPVRKAQGALPKFVKPEPEIVPEVPMEEVVVEEKKLSVEAEEAVVETVNEVSTVEKDTEKKSD